MGHALLLINEGFLDACGEQELARRVGYSARQLRRCFAEVVGATPNAVARSRRTHLARRLLDETDLRVTDIAYTTGFSSVRQMNRDVRRVFDFSPSELRQRRRAGDLVAVDGGLSLRAPYLGLHDVDATMDFLAQRSLPGVETVRDRTYRRTIAAGSHFGVIEVTADPGASGLVLTVHLPTFSSILDDVARTRCLFATEADPSEAVDHLGGDALIGDLVGSRPGLRMPGVWDRFETAIRIVLGQHISVAAARTIAGRLACRFGSEVGVPEHPHLNRLFPTAATLSEVPIDELASIGIPRTRAQAVQGLAQAVVAERIDLTADVSPLRESLLPIVGIGPWTADVVALRVNHSPDAFAAGDLGLRQAVGHLDGRQTPTTAELDELARPWAPHRSTAAIHLWQSLSDRSTE